MAGRSRDVLSRLEGWPLPDAQVVLVEAWQRDRVTVEPARAATVVLLRDGTDGLQTYLLQRHARMPFAPGMVVFPGGRVDPVDGTGDDDWRRCAVRETREETGVELRTDELVDWAHWITPAFETRRYDTRFYLAALPTGAVARDQSGETDRAGWSRPAAALADLDAGRIALMPPTRSVLLELAELAERADTAAVLAAGADRLVEVVRPEPVRSGDGWVFRYGGTDGGPG